MSKERLAQLVEAGEKLHTALHNLPKEVAEPYLPHFQILLDMIERGKKDQDSENSA